MKQTIQEFVHFIFHSNFQET